MGDELVEAEAWLDIHISHSSHHTLAVVHHTGQADREELVADTCLVDDDMGLVLEQCHDRRENNLEAWIVGEMGDQAVVEYWIVGEEAVLNQEQRRGFVVQLVLNQKVSLRELRLLHVEQYQSRNQTCPTWPMQKQYPIFARCDACFLRHESMLS